MLYRVLVDQLFLGVGKIVIFVLWTKSDLARFDYLLVCLVVKVLLNSKTSFNT